MKKKPWCGVVEWMSGMVPLMDIGRCCVGMSQSVTEEQNCVVGREQRLRVTVEDE